MHGGELGFSMTIMAAKRGVGHETLGQSKDTCYGGLSYQGDAFLQSSFCQRDKELCTLSPPWVKKLLTEK